MQSRQQAQSRDMTNRTSQSNDLFQSLSSYSFNTDPEFAKGLAIILGHPDTPATESEINREDDLVVQAKCFFFSRYSWSM